MKKWLVILPICLILAACSDDKSNDVSQNSNNVETKKASEPKQEVTVEKENTDVNNKPEEDMKEEVEADDVVDTNSEEAVVESKGIVEYMPKRPIKKIFLLQDFEIVREVKSVKGNRLLESITFGDVVTMQISEWTPTKLTMLFNDSDGDDDVTIDNFETTTAPEVYIDTLNEQTGSQAWKVVDQNVTLKMPAGVYEDVLVIEQIIVSKTSDQKTITRYYYGKGLGLIKEETITQSGNNETSYVMELDRIE